MRGAARHRSRKGAAQVRQCNDNDNNNNNNNDNNNNSNNNNNICYYRLIDL